jgi:hypothetical protein
VKSVTLMRPISAIRSAGPSIFRTPIGCFRAVRRTAPPTRAVLRTMTSNTRPRRRCVPASNICSKKPASCAQQRCDSCCLSLRGGQNSSLVADLISPNKCVQIGRRSGIVVVRVMYQWQAFGGPLGFQFSKPSDGTRLFRANPTNDPLPACVSRNGGNNICLLYGESVCGHV